jgi:hypothetical protein
VVSLLKTLFAGIFLVMVAVTVRASLDRSVFVAFGEIAADPWGLATLADAYCGFLTFYAWVAYKETSGLARGGWFVAIMLFGNLAMAAYALYQLFRLPADATAADLLLRRPRAAA